MIEPERPILAVAGGNPRQAFNEQLPKCPVFRLRSFVVVPFTLCRGTGEDASWRQHLKRIALNECCVTRLRVIQPNLLEQSQLARGVVIEAIRALLGGVVVLLELLALEAGRDAISGGDDPLQERVWLVMSRSSIHEGICRNTRV